MKTRIFATAALMLFYTSCNAGNLTKEEAKKQIEEQLSAGKKANYIELQKDRRLYVIKSDRDYNTRQLANKGQEYVRLDLRTEYGYEGQIPIINGYEILPKGKPFLVNPDGSNANYRYLCFGKHVVTVRSMTEPAPSADGSIVCKVTYTDELELNEFGKEIEAAISGCNGEHEMTAKFTKMQDGWQINKPHED